MRKVVEKQGGLTEDRKYLGDYEVYRKTQSGTVDTERETVHVSDDRHRICLFDILTVENGSPKAQPTITTRYQLNNQLGSSCVELDENASLISYEEYHPFGTSSYRAGRSTTEVAQKRYRYVGKERDEESGLYYYGMRYYAQWLCRFISVDPLIHEYPIYTPYQYAGNKPIIAIDLDGAEPKPINPEQEYSDEDYDILQVSDEWVIETNQETGEEKWIKTGVFSLDENAVNITHKQTTWEKITGFFYQNGQAILDGTQLGLDVLGLIPVLGAIPDVINAGISALRGNFLDASLSLTAAIPLVGIGAGIAKLGGKAAQKSKFFQKALRRGQKAQDAADAARGASRHSDNVARNTDEFANWGDEISDNARMVDQPFRQGDGILRNADESVSAARGVKKYADGTFSISNWKGYPSGPQPSGTFRLLEGTEYVAARKLANKTNTAIRKANPSLYKGKHIHEIKPVKYGGSPTAPANKIALTPKEHAKYTTYWNKLMREIKK